jgi:hypothetical protein
MDRRSASALFSGQLQRWLGSSLKPHPFGAIVAELYINWQPDKTLESDFDHVRSRKVTGWSL